MANQHLIFGYILSLVPELFDAEDLLQKTSLVLWRKFDELPQTEGFLPWAYRIAKFEIYNYLRLKRHRHATFSDVFLEEISAARLDRDDLRISRLSVLPECMNHLGEAARRLIERYYEQKTPIRQIAEQFGRTVGGVYKSLGRIRMALMDCINRALRAEKH